MMVYRFKDAAHLNPKLDAQAVGDRIAELRESEGAGFTPETVVRDARSKRSPLHLAFTWDDAAAAEQYRLQEAGYLIRNVVTIVTAEHGDHEVRAFVPVTVRDVEERRYIPLFTAMNDEDYRRQILATALGEMLALRRKYQDLEEFSRIFKAIDQTAKQLKAA